MSLIYADSEVRSYLLHVLLEKPRVAVAVARILTNPLALDEENRSDIGNYTILMAGVIRLEKNKRIAQQLLEILRRDKVVKGLEKRGYAVVIE